MASMSTYLRNALANHVLRGAPYPVPATVYLALYTAAPDENGGGQEVTGGSYARQPITFRAPSLGATSNEGVVTYTNMPASVLQAGALMDSLNGGNMLFYGLFGSPRTIAAGTDASFSDGELDVTFA